MSDEGEEDSSDQTTSEVGQGVGIAANAAMGNYVGAAIGAVGLGISLFGAKKSSDASKQISQYQTQIVQGQEAQEDIKQQAVQLNARRRSMQAIRTGQAARAAGLVAATNQGGQFGSGLQGGYGGISGATQNNLLGIQQDLSLSNQLYQVGRQIDTAKIGLAGSQSKQSQGNALMSLGGAVVQNQGTLTSIGKTATSGWQFNQGTTSGFSV